MRLLNDAESNKDKTNEETRQQGTNTDEIVHMLPLSLQNRATKLLEYLLKHSDLRWNDQNEIEIKGNTIFGSNIIDLIKSLLKDYKDFHPTGFDHFSQFVLDTNVPKSLLLSSKSQIGGALKLPPPPGIPKSTEERIFTTPGNQKKTSSRKKIKETPRIFTTPDKQKKKSSQKKITETPDKRKSIQKKIKWLKL